VQLSFVFGKGAHRFLQTGRETVLQNAFAKQIRLWIAERFIDHSEQARTKIAAHRFKLFL
jgi:hypothetical protein